MISGTKTHISFFFVNSIIKNCRQTLHRYNYQIINKSLTGQSPPEHHFSEVFTVVGSASQPVKHYVDRGNENFPDAVQREEIAQKVEMTLF